MFNDLLLILKKRVKNSKNDDRQNGTWNTPNGKVFDQLEVNRLLPPVLYRTEKFSYRIINEISANRNRWIDA